MIANIFLPERYKNFFLFPQRIASVIINASTVRITIIRATRSQRFIEQLIEEPISTDQSLPLAERSIAALTTILKHIPADCRLIGILPSTQVICKIIETPPMSLAKIKLIVPFEIESSLPFPLESALIDCIMIQERSISPTEKRTQVLVVATRQDTVNEYRSLFETAGRIPDCITTDTVALFGFSTELSPLPLKQEEPCILLCVDQHMTIVMRVVQGQLTTLRTIARGQFDVFSGKQVEQSSFQSLISEIVGTLRNVPSTMARTSKGEQSSHLFICGIGAENKEFCEALTQHIASDCELLTINKILHSGTIQSNLGLTNNMLLTVASSLPLTSTETFNLDRATAHLQEEQLIRKQLITVSVILALIFCIALTARILSVRNLSREVSSAEKDTIESLTKRLDLKGKQSLDSINRIARAEVDHRKKIWFALATQRRSTPLIVLQELSKRINREELGLSLQLLVFNEDTKTIILEGAVKDFPALRKLEESLSQSSLLKLESKLQELQFTAKLILDIAAEDQ